MSTLTYADLESVLGELGLKTPIPLFPSADVINKPLDIARSYFADILCTSVGCDTATAYNSIQWPNNISNGDLSVILPKLSHGQVSETLAFELMQKFPECPLFILPFPEGKHLLIMFNPQVLPRLFLPYITDRKIAFGQDVSLGLQNPSQPELGRKKIVVEFSSPNIAQNFEGKHLRSTILGAYIANLYESMGWDVTRINYLGDWGKPMALLGLGWEKFGSEEQFEADPMGHLLEVYHKILDLFAPEEAARKKARDEKADTAVFESQGLFAERNALFIKLEEGDENALTLWKRVREVSVEAYKQLYARLNINFDDYSGESTVTPEAMAEVEEILRSKDLCEDLDGAWGIDLKKHTGKAGAALMRDRSGSRTYLLRDLAAALERSRKYSFDKMIYVVANDHNPHFSRLSKILELMDMAELASKLQQISFKEDSQMSAKLGHKRALLGDILDQCQVRMMESLKANPEQAALLGDNESAASEIGIAALLAEEQSSRKAADHAFDFDHITSFTLGTGPNLRYWYARLGETLKTGASDGTPEDDFASVEEEDQNNLLRILIQYPEVTQSAYRNQEPATIMSYLATITAQLQTCFDNSPEEPVTSPALVKLYEATRIVLKNGMKVLGIGAGGE